MEESEELTLSADDSSALDSNILGFRKDNSLPFSLFLINPFKVDLATLTKSLQMTKVDFEEQGNNDEITLESDVNEEQS